jgi:hypothetical protein
MADPVGSWRDRGFLQLLQKRSELEVQIRAVLEVEISCLASEDVACLLQSGGDILRVRISEKEFFQERSRP